MNKRQFILLTAFVLGTLLPVVYLAQVASDPVREAFKLGTFAHQGRFFAGLVLRDTIVIDIEKANAALERENPSWRKFPMPRDMKELIRGYEEKGPKERLQAIINKLADVVPSPNRPTYVYDLGAIKVLPPIVYPETLVNAAINYEEHAQELQQAGQVAGGEQSSSRQGTTAAVEEIPSIPGLWERKPGDTRHNPYLFLKARSAVIADREAIRIPPGRDRIDWECEFAVVIGRQASRVPIERAKDYIFGYTLENDVSDRGGRADGRHGSDWLVGKGHDTFAPLGPFIVPKEFIKDPQNLGIQLTLNGEVMQDSNTAHMIHSVFELVHYASNVLTLQPGDVISTGSPAGVGFARSPPIFMKPGDVAVCSVEQVGILTNPVVAFTAPSASSQPSR